MAVKRFFSFLSAGEEDEARRVVGLDLGVGKEWITVLPEGVLGGCEKLATLGLEGCGKLMVLPDLSSRPELKVEGLPKHLSEWEKGGRKRYDFMRDGFWTAKITVRGATMS